MPRTDENGRQLKALLEYLLDGDVDAKDIYDALGISSSTYYRRIKDADYPNHLSPISVDLTLTDEWQTWEIDLAEFEPNDLSRLHIPLGLLIFPAEEPMSFSIRNARYR